jgi:glutathione synthase/RimK-type ligase-like ATP-grasp enzyme
MPEFDIAVLTERRFYQPKEITPYIANVLLEDQLIANALQARGLRVTRKSWDDATFDWSFTRYALFRTTWDYFHRFAEFESWLNKAKQQTAFINPLDLVHWNLDKHYLRDLAGKGVNIPPTHFIEPGDKRSLAACISDLPYTTFILKPAIAGTARHTYRFTKETVHQHEAIFSKLLQNESMLIQEYQTQITTKGELSLMLFNGVYSHAVRKRAKVGDFRVQDDFGGTVQNHEASGAEIAFAKRAVAACAPFKPLYARVDICWDNQDALCLAELELIEPELWFRQNDDAAGRFADALVQYLKG